MTHIENHADGITDQTMREIGQMLGQSEQCVNKACGDDASDVIQGDAFCAVHAAMVAEM